jgi:dCMP deaminase
MPSGGPMPRRERLDSGRSGERMGWHDYFLGIAESAAARSDCTRSRVGAVLVRDHRVRSTGYNGAPSGMAGCGSCPRSRSGVASLTGDYDTPGARGACVAVHAEVNAVLYAERSDVVGSTVYVTRTPCTACIKTLRAAGVALVVYRSDPTAQGTRPLVMLDLRPDCGEGGSCSITSRTKRA